MTDNVKISAIPASLIDVVWPTVSGQLDRVVKKAPGELDLNVTKDYLLTGKNLLLCVSRDQDILASIVLDVRTFDGGTKCIFIQMAGGDELDLWMDRVVEITNAIGIDYKCDEMRIVCARKGWTRKFPDWEEAHVTIRKPIGDS